MKASNVPKQGFPRNVVLGGKLVLWGEKIEKHPKFVIVWGGGGGEISPPKAPEKNTVPKASSFSLLTVCSCLQ